MHRKSWNGSLDADDNRELNARRHTNFQTNDTLLPQSGDDSHFGGGPIPLTTLNCKPPKWESSPLFSIELAP
jgi:hypothetical protein